MRDVFISTHWAGATRQLLVNSEKVLFLERLEQDLSVSYLVRFDNGQDLELDQGTGEALKRQLQNIDRPRPPVQYVRHEGPEPRSPRFPRRSRASVLSDNGVRINEKGDVKR